MNIKTHFVNHKKIYFVAIIALVCGALLGGLFGGNSRWERHGKFYSKEAKHMMKKDGSHSMQGGMMKDMMMDMTSSLKGKTGDEFDKVFLSEMIVHHEGAVDMAKMVLESSKRPELIKLANDIISAQTKEIDMMKTWEKTWFQPITDDHDTSQVACTMDAKICPDGSAVGRQGPHCEFAPCPNL